MRARINNTIQNHPEACACALGGLLLFGIEMGIAYVKTRRQLKKNEEAFIRCKTKMSRIFNDWENGNKQL